MAPTSKAARSVVAEGRQISDGSGADDAGAVARTMLAVRVDVIPVVDPDGRLFSLVTLWHFAEPATGGRHEELPRGSTAQPTGKG